MHLDKYDYQVIENGESFIFESVGPKGVIKKVVNYQLMHWSIGNIPVINLAFGDWNQETEKIDDLVISNNNDRDKVLATVASTVLVYMKTHARLAVHAKGSIPVKTRLYQMGINANRTEIELFFSVFGQIGKSWHPFQSGYNYEAFLIFKK